MYEDKVKFINRFYVYINQIFGDLQVREKILRLFNLPEEALVVKEDIDEKTGQVWDHHIAINLKTKKQYCSVKEGHQEIYSDDIACQSYSIYNTLIINKNYIKNSSVNEDKKEYVKSLKS